MDRHITKEKTRIFLCIQDSLKFISKNISFSNILKYKMKEFRLEVAEKNEFLYRKNILRSWKQYYYIIVQYTIR